MQASPCIMTFLLLIIRWSAKIYTPQNEILSTPRSSPPRCVIHLLRVGLAHESGMCALQVEDLENDERYRCYHGVQRDMRSDVLRRPVINVNHDHFDRLRQQLPIPATEKNANSNNAIVDSRLRPRCAICCHCIRQQSQTAWRPLTNTLEIWYLLRGAQVDSANACMPHGPLCENVMTSSTKPEVCNTLHCRQRTNEPRLQLT